MSLKPGKHVLKACSSSHSEHPDELLEALPLVAVPRGYLSIKKGNSSARVPALTVQQIRCTQSSIVTDHHDG